MSEHTELATKLEEINKAILASREQKDRLDEAQKQTQGDVALLKEQYEKSQKDLEALAKEASHLKAEVDRAREGGSKKDRDEREIGLFMKAVREWVRNPRASVGELKSAVPEYFDMVKKSAGEEVSKAMEVGDGSSGGLLVNRVWSQRVMEYLYAWSDVRQAVTVEPFDGDVMDMAKDTAAATFSWLGESGTKSSTNDLSFGVESIKMHAGLFAADVTWALLKTARIDLESYILNKWGMDYPAKEGRAVVEGSGSYSPSGFINDTNVQSNYTASGAASTIGTSPDFLAEMIAALAERSNAYLRNASWGMNATTWSSVVNLKTGDSQYYHVAGTRDGNPFTLKGLPVRIWSDMPDEGANEYPIVLADFRRGYKLLHDPDVFTQVDQYTQNMSAQTRIVGYYRVGGGVVDSRAFQVLKCATS